MGRQTDYLQVIQAAYPDLSIQNTRLHNKDGQYNDILIVNDEIIFRFSRYPEGIENIRNEVHLLTRIQGYTTLSIPNPIYTHMNTRTIGKVFMGYKMIPGEPLWRETVHDIEDDEVLQRLATQLAGFLQELHSVPIEVPGTDMPINDRREEWENLYAEFREHLFPFMRPDARDDVSNHFAAYLDEPRLHRYNPSLRHGDFGTGNILYDRKNQVISGIIDFGFAGLGDPALDIAAAMSYGESFFARYADAYLNIESMLERAHFYRGTFALYEALYGIKHGDREAFESGIAAYI